MDAPRRRLQMRGGFAGLQLPAGVRTGVRVRRGLAVQARPRFWTGSCFTSDKSGNRCNSAKGKDAEKA